MAISPYDEGVIAANDFVGVDDNPYPEGSDDRKQWEDGFQAASWKKEDTAGYEEARAQAQETLERLQNDLSKPSTMTASQRELVVRSIEMLSKALEKERG